jgi:hypothetical protein
MQTSKVRESSISVPSPGEEWKWSILAKEWSSNYQFYKKTINATSLAASSC